MSQEISLKEAEREAYKLATFEDGLWDIYVGGFFVFLSFYSVTRKALGPALNLILVLAVAAFLLAGMTLARRAYSTPRLGRVKLRRRRKVTITFISLAFVLFTLLLAILLITGVVREPDWGGAPGWVRDLDVDIFFTALVIGFFSLGAHFTGVPRLHLYGWLIGVGNLASTALNLYAGFTFHFPLAIAGGIILLIGTLMFYRFIKEYAVQTEKA